MAFLNFKNIRIAGIAAGVPKNIVNNHDVEMQSGEYEAADFVEATGVRERRIGDITTSDLCYATAKQLIADLNWDKKEIEALIFVSQTADYILPCTACILQDRLGLSKECYALDCTLGCSGWVYGLTEVAGILQQNGIRKALLCVGDARRRAIVPGREDVIKYGDPLFGHAGTVTAIEYVEGESGLQFHVGTDGSGYDAIITPDGGSRNPFNIHSFDLTKDESGVLKSRLSTRMKGMDVFAFGITVPSKSIKKLAEHFNINLDGVDYFVFHQANKKMNDTIIKKMKLDSARVPLCMREFGNTSSASIPLTIVSQIGDKVRNGKTNFIACGFGVGLSWATVAFTTENIVISKLVEVEEE
jgi:3-oxoacyl-[acyl-carrier-protein] synthase-3